MNTEQIIKQIIADIKKVELHELNSVQSSNFIEAFGLDSFEVVSFVDKLDSIFKIEFGSQSTDFDSLKSWSALLANIESKINHE